MELNIREFVPQGIAPASHMNQFRNPGMVPGVLRMELRHPETDSHGSRVYYQGIRELVHRSQEWAKKSGNWSLGPKNEPGESGN